MRLLVASWLNEEKTHQHNNYIDTIDCLKLSSLI
jgi:hypothetical protein